VHSFAGGYNSCIVMDMNSARMEARREEGERKGIIKGRIEGRKDKYNFIGIKL
jgi:hypothetical protein